MTSVKNMATLTSPELFFITNGMPQAVPGQSNFDVPSRLLSAYPLVDKSTTFEVVCLISERVKLQKDLLFVNDGVLLIITKWSNRLVAR